MAHIILRPEWHISSRQITPEAAFLNRRQFLRNLGGVGTAAAFAALGSGPRLGLRAQESVAKPAGRPVKPRYPATRNPEFNPAWKLTDENAAGVYNNFYEFSLAKDKVHQRVGKFVIAPWPIEIGGLVEKPMKLDLEELLEQVTIEERIYRFRCVEAWAMIVPWTGFPLSQVLEKVQPKPEAKFVRFVTFNRPDQAPGMLDPSYPWPYTEGLRLDEAMHPLTLLATGIYGKPLPKQHGAPIRVVVPWKYGYKSIKSIVKIELVDKQPATLWETLLPQEYPFESNVNPAVPHPRWSQATERMIDSGDRVRTQAYNGYGNLVAKLYPKPKA